MPGLVGFIGTRRDSDDGAALRCMQANLAQAPFYRTGAYENAELGLHAGWTTRAGNFDDCLPAWNAARDIGLLFCGEEYGGHETRADQLLERCEQLGENFYASLNGWFSGLVMDLRRRSVTLFNDRYG